MTLVWQLLAVTSRMLRQNRWLLLLVIAWPLGVTVLLLWPRASPMQLEDMLPVLQQEALYGVAMVGIAASTQLGREERSRRVFEVLGRSVGRSEYILIMALVAWLPLAAYVASLTLSMEAVTVVLGKPLPMLGRFVGEQLVAGILVAGGGMLFAVLLPPNFATGSTLSLAAVLTGMGRLGVPGPPRLLYALADLQLRAGAAESILDSISTLAAGGLLCWAACLVYRRRDLRLTE